MTDVMTRLVAHAHHSTAQRCIGGRTACVTRVHNQDFRGDGAGTVRVRHSTHSVGACWQSEGLAHA